jgi:predicted ATP-grasp superfamily ATP-dependent carboligase
MSILVVGLSTRAIAESAVRSGCRVVTVDYFGDRDQKEKVENHSLLRDLKIPFSAAGLLAASRRVEFSSVGYISNLENYPEIVAEFAKRGRLLGNTPDVLREARDWRQLRRLCREEGIPLAVTLLPGQEREAVKGSRWLLKPVRSGGGHGISFWNGSRLKETHVLQRFVEGRPASAAFVADGKNSVVIGISEQLIGCRELGAREFAWCGNILPLRLARPSRAAFLETVETMVARLTCRLGLRGVNGLDLVVADDANGCPTPFLVEVNPRYTGSMELVESAYGLNVFSVHLDAMAGRLPRFSLAQHMVGRPFAGKGIVFAGRTSIVPEAMGGVERGRRDIPFPGDLIKAGHPICTVFGEGDGRESCLENIVANAWTVRREIGDELEDCVE